MNRRKFLSLAPAGALAAVAAPGALAQAHAAAPFAKTSAPGFYRMPIGDLEVTALLDGTAPVSLTTMYNNTTPAHVEKALADVFLRSPVELSVNAYLVNTGERLVLIDAGTGRLMGPRLGRLPEALKASGYQPEQVDSVLLTHIHTDHSGGLVIDGARVFPNASVHVNKRDADYWLDPANRDAAPEAAKVWFDEAVASLKPYQDADRFHTFDDHAEPIPGFRSVWRPGHTPGHSAFVIENKGETLMVWGDITHGDVLQFDEPDVSIDFDVDSAKAAVTRAQAFKEAAERRYWVAGAHISFPGIGHVRADATGYDWVPANYSVGG